jgi:flavodoxin
VRALIVYHSRTGVTEKLMRAVGEELEHSGHRVEYHKLEPIRPLGYLGACVAALRRREVELKADLPKTLRTHELVVVAGPVQAGRTSAELNTFLNNMPDGIGRRFGVFATMGSGSAEGQMKSIKTRIEKAGGLIVYEDAVRKGVVINSDQLAARARDIAEQLLRPSVW